MNSGAAYARIYWARGLFGILKTAQNHLKRKQLESDPNCFPNCFPFLWSYALALTVSTDNGGYAYWYAM